MALDFARCKQVMDLLEDFEVVGTFAEIALLPRQRVRTALHENVHAAIVASTSGLSSIDYAKRRYCPSYPEPAPNQPDKAARDLYIKAYSLAKQYVLRMIRSLHTDGLPLPDSGVFGASLVLERLPYSFFSAHLLYQLGQRYEGHAVARLILEQIAWAYAAHPIKEIEGIDAIVTTKAISQLKKLAPEVGILYGFLSEKTHIDYRSHVEFLKIKNNKNVIIYAQPMFKEYAMIMLELADIFGIVWEISQIDYISTPEAIIRGSNGVNINESRPYLVEKERLIADFDVIQQMASAND
jgi:hypothetical protein